MKSLILMFSLLLFPMIGNTSNYAPVYLDLDKEYAEYFHCRVPSDMDYKIDDDIVITWYVDGKLKTWDEKLKVGQKPRPMVYTRNRTDPAIKKWGDDFCMFLVFRGYLGMTASKHDYYATIPRTGESWHIVRFNTGFGSKPTGAPPMPPSISWPENFEEDLEKILLVLAEDGDLAALENRSL